MAWVYILRGSKGRCYIGATEDLQTRIARHNSGMVHSTKRLGLPLKLVGSKKFETIAEAFTEEKRLKKWKNPKKVIEFLQS